MSQDTGASIAVLRKCDSKRCRHEATTVIWQKEPRRRLQFCSKHAEVKVYQNPDGLTWAEIY